MRKPHWMATPPPQDAARRPDLGFNLRHGSTVRGSTFLFERAISSCLFLVCRCLVHFSLVAQLKTLEDFVDGISAWMGSRRHIQVFTNLSSELGDFAVLSTAHMILSVKEGYNLVISELAMQHLPVIANDLPCFSDRVIHGLQGGWTVHLPKHLKEMHQVNVLLCTQTCTFSTLTNAEQAGK